MNLLGCDQDALPFGLAHMKGIREIPSIAIGFVRGAIGYNGAKFNMILDSTNDFQLALEEKGRKRHKTALERFFDIFNDFALRRILQYT